MNQKIKDALRELASASEAAGRAAERLSAALAQQSDPTLPSFWRDIEPGDLADLCFANAAAQYAFDRGSMAFVLMATLGTRNGRGWEHELSAAMKRKAAAITGECTCGTCKLCSASSAAVSRAHDIARAAGRPPR